MIINAREGQTGFSVTLDGVEISGECFYADDVARLVKVYLRDGTGNFYMGPLTGQAASEERHGVVVITKSVNQDS